MTDKQKERHREYMREWSKRNPEKIREYRRNRMRRAALAAILAERETMKRQIDVVPVTGG